MHHKEVRLWCKTRPRSHMLQTVDHDGIDEEVYMQVNLIDYTPISEEKVKEFAAATKDEPALEKLKRVVLNGWPEERDQVDPELRPYWNYREEISVHDDLLYRSERLIVPAALRPEMLRLIHQGHERHQIKDVVAKFATCCEFRKTNHQDPLLPHHIPGRPWQKVGADLFEINSEQYLILEDHYSKYFEISKLSSTTSNATILYCKSHFARHGIPEEVFTDNGPQFASEEFKKFAVTWGFTHTTSSPRYPQSNGMAERSVQTVENLLKKAKMVGQDPYLVLLAFRSTTVDDLGSPAELLMGRRIQTQLPITVNPLRPKVAQEVPTKLQARQLKQKSYYDRTAHPLPPLAAGDTVRVRTKPQHWEPAVLHKEAAPRSYIVKTRGRMLRSNRRDIVKTREPAPLVLPPDEDQATEEERSRPTVKTREPAPLALPPDEDQAIETPESRPELDLQKPPQNPPTPATASSNKHAIVTRYSRIVWPNPRYLDEWT